VVFFLLRSRPRFRRRGILWGKKPFPSIQANLLLKGFVKTPEGKKLLETAQLHERVVETMINSKPKTRKGSPPMLEARYAQWFAGLKRVRIEQLITEHNYLIEFSYFALTEMETGGKVLPDTIEIIRERLAQVRVDCLNAYDAKTFNELFPP